MKRKRLGIALLAFGVMFPGTMSAADSGIFGIESVLASWTLTAFPTLGLACCVIGGLMASTRWFSRVTLMLVGLIAMASIEVTVMTVEFCMRGFRPGVF